MDNLRHDTNLPFTNAKHLLKCRKGAMIGVVGKATLVDVRGNGVSRQLIFRCKKEPRFGIDEAADQPSGAHAIDSWPGARNPDTCAIVFGRDRPRNLGGRRRLAIVLHAVQQFLYAFAEWIVKEVDRHDFLKALANPPETRGRAIRARYGTELAEFPQKLLIVLRARFDEAFNHLRSRDIVNGLDLHDRYISPISPHR